jgi:hypothetical protein
MHGINVFIMQIDYVKILCKEDVYICHTNFTKKTEQNSHGTTSRWKMYRKRLFSKDLEVQDVMKPSSNVPILNTNSLLNFIHFFLSIFMEAYGHFKVEKLYAFYTCMKTKFYEEIIFNEK